MFISEETTIRYGKERRNQKTVREISDVDKPVKVLDVACGTADFTIEIARKVMPGSKVLGVDISEGMMDIGREKIVRHYPTRMTYSTAYP